MQLITYPNKILREKAKKIKTPIDKEILDMIPKMAEIMRNSNGMGLAAPQVGKSLKLYVIDYDEKLYAFINPVITAKSKDKILEDEGCLSFPKKFIPVERSRTVKVRYLDEKGNKCKIKAEGIFARCIQHELDHLDGILLIDNKQKNGKRRNTSSNS